MAPSLHGKVTPESILAIPEFEGPWPNESGGLLLYIVRKYNYADNEITGEPLVRDGAVYMRHSRTEATHLLHSGPDIQTAFWVQGSDNVILVEGIPDKDQTRISMLSLGAFAGHEPRPFEEICILPTKAQGLAAVERSETEFVLAFSAQTDRNGGLITSEKKTLSNPLSSGFEFSGHMRLRDDLKGVAAERLTIFCATFLRSGVGWTKSNNFNTLLGLGADFQDWSGMHMNSHGLVLITSPDKADIAAPHLTSPYFISMSSITCGSHNERIKLQMPGFTGRSSSPQISKSGESVWFFQKRTGRFEDDLNHLVVCEGLQGSPVCKSYELCTSDSPSIQLSPEQLEILDGGSIYFIADARAEKRFFHTTLQPGQPTLAATSLTEKWSVGSFQIPADDQTSILLAGSSMTNPRRWAELNTTSGGLNIIAEGTAASDNLRLNEISFEETEWVGGDDLTIRAWVVKPRDFDPSKKYPLLYYIHGGPNLSINNAWFTSYDQNWNLPLLAEQGFLVIVPNASGSTGFGREFAGRLTNAWGVGYTDHVRGFEHIKTNMPYVDTDRAICAGYSYGAFMVNWIQGHELGRQFKAMIAEAAYINLATRYTQYLIFSIEDHYGGPAYQKPRKHDRNNPIDHIEHWATPTLFISNGQDTVPATEGMAAFSVLQTKGVPTRIMGFPDEGHLVEKPGNRLHWWRSVIAWCHEHTG